MKTYKIAAALFGLFASAIVMAQMPASPTQGAQPTDPSAASSPHQRDTIRSPSSEAPANSSGSDPSNASTPAQKDSVRKTHKHKKAVKPDKTQSPQS